MRHLVNAALTLTAAVRGCAEESVSPQGYACSRISAIEPVGETVNHAEGLGVGGWNEERDEGDQEQMEDVLKFHGIPRARHEQFGRAMLPQEWAEATLFAPHRVDNRWF